MSFGIFARTALGVVLVVVTRGADLPSMQKGALNLRVTQEQISASGSNWRTSWGSFSKDYANKRVLVVSMKQHGQFDPRITVKWYFIGRDVVTKKLGIYDRGERATVVDADGAEFVVTSKEILSNRSRENTPPRAGVATLSNGYPVDVLVSGRTGPTKQTGVTPHGWCVVVLQDGRVVTEVASIPELVGWTRSYLAAAAASR